jgi:hypothetical protein
MIAALEHPDRVRHIIIIIIIINTHLLPGLDTRRVVAVTLVRNSTDEIKS